MNLWPFMQQLLFKMDAEDAHRWTLETLDEYPNIANRLLKLTSTLPQKCHAHGRRFTVGFSIGLAGLDKDGEALPVWENVGFGFIEVGTVTAHAQEGNPRPRLFRLKDDEGIINRMGFNNLGSLALMKQMWHCVN